MLEKSKAYFSAQFKAYFPTGASVQGLGTNHYSIEPAILYYGRFSQRFELEGEIGGWVPIGGSKGIDPTSNTEFAGNIFFYGIGPSYRIIDGEKFHLSPVVELVGWNVTSGQQTGTPADASGTNIVNLKLGARMPNCFCTSAIEVSVGFTASVAPILRARSRRNGFMGISDQHTLAFAVDDVRRHSHHGRIRRNIPKHY